MMNAAPLATQCNVTYSPPQTKLSPIDLAMQRVSLDDTEAYEVVYRVGAPLVRRMLRRLGADETTADDLTHETLLRVYEHRARFHGNGRFAPWAYTIARRLFVDRIRKIVSESNAVLAFCAIQVQSQMLLLADDLLANRRRVAQVGAAMARLPPRQAEALRMVHHDGLSFAEVSEQTGDSLVCLRIRSHRAVKAIRETLQEDDDGSCP